MVRISLLAAESYFALRDSRSQFSPNFVLGRIMEDAETHQSRNLLIISAGFGIVNEAWTYCDDPEIHCDNKGPSVVMYFPNVMTNDDYKADEFSLSISSNRGRSIGLLEQILVSLFKNEKSQSDTKCLKGKKQN
uniref:Uncharacterized protein n=1 Tax=Glossina palpalis gambiensis TaxID=67801 RepID=A0A1B0BK31_9MUSC